jgi:alpha-ketoglutarate-dependent 2,4-dichlorophenoxyacetate dioxygenase
MTLEIIPMDPGRSAFAAQVKGVDPSRPISDEEVRAIEKGMDRYGVLVFRGRALTEAQHLEFSIRFGQLEAPFDVPGQASQKERLAAAFNDISNLDRNNQVMAQNDRRRLYQLGNMLWHSDSSYKSTPAKYSLLYARAIPDHGGATQFADMRDAWDTLDEATKKLALPLIGEHSRLFSRAELGFEFNDQERLKYAPVPQRLVRRHPSTRRLSLYLSSHCGNIVGFPLPEARALLRELTEHATQRERVYSHAWRTDDLVMWDNRVTMHRGTRYPSDQVRDMRRTTLVDSAPTIDQPV